MGVRAQIYPARASALKASSIVYLIYQGLARKAVEDELHENENEDQVQVQEGDCSRWRQSTKYMHLL